MESKISYDPLWDTLKSRGMKKMKFAKEVGISNATLAKLGKNEPVSLTTIEKFCEYFNCSISHIVEYAPVIEREKKDVLYILNVIDAITSRQDEQKERRYSNGRRG